jgi:hypothetical protein
MRFSGVEEIKVLRFLGINGSDFQDILVLRYLGIKVSGFELS